MNIPLDEWSGSKATKELQKKIEEIQEENSGQAKWMLGLTFIAAVAAIIAAWPVIKGWIG